MNLSPYQWADPAWLAPPWVAPSRRRGLVSQMNWPQSRRLWDLAGLVPSLDLRFADTQGLRDWVTGQNLVTFTRSTTATYVGRDGNLQTAAVNEPRFQYDPITCRCLGLLIEEQRTNILLNSSVLSTQDVAVTATTYTLSFTGTGTITLTGSSTAGPLVGTGDGENNRVSLTFTPTAGTLTLTVSGNVVNAQLEAGVMKTSYIPTTSTQVTRAVDSASLLNDSFSSWFNYGEFSLYAEFVLTFALTSGSANCCIWSFGGGVPRIYLVIGNTVGFRTMTCQLYDNPNNINFNYLSEYGNSGNYPLNQTIKVAMSSNTSSVRITVKGLQPTTYNPSVGERINLSSIQRQSRIGNRGETNNPFNGYISRLTYWPRQLDNRTMQQLTR